MSDIDDLIQRSQEARVEAGNKNLTPPFHLALWLARGAALAPPWWSPARDAFLRNFWRATDHLAGAVYSFVAKMTTIPVRVEARDASVAKWVKEAEAMSEVVNIAPGGGLGWVSEFGKFVLDLITQDNGAFMEIIGEGDPSGPIRGRPLSIAHLDSARCTRTGNYEYPVIYSATDGSIYKLHRTRVMFASQLPAPEAEMFGVGLCAVSRCMNIAQTMMDVLTYKQEKIGSRPPRKLLITRGGLDPQDLREAIELAQMENDNSAYQFYSHIAIGGSPTLMDADVRSIDLVGMPDGFDEQTSINLGMAAIAMAFGVDARELWPASESGATRADALIQHLKQRGKAPGQIISMMEQLMNFYFLPPYLQFKFDFQDDAEDMQRAQIRQIRANARVQDMSTGAVPANVMRRIMYIDGDVDQKTVEMIEAEDGRLYDGTDILTLFYSKDRIYQQLLDLGVEDALDVINNDRQMLAGRIAAARRACLKLIATTNSDEAARKARLALSALQYLIRYYRNYETNYSLSPAAGRQGARAPEAGQDGDGQDGGAGDAAREPARRTQARLDEQAPAPNRIEDRQRRRSPAQSVNQYTAQDIRRPLEQPSRDSEV